MVPSVKPRPIEKEFTTRRPSSSTRRCSVRLAPIAEDSSLLPPVGVWAVLNPSVADHPLRPATDRSPGRPLPHQLANRAQAHLVALPKRSFARCRAYAGLSAISRRYPSPQGRYPRVTHPSATRFLRSACDLHVLRTPPAFILSQDQTRHPELYLQYPPHRRYQQAVLLSCDPGQAAVSFIALGCSQMSALRAL